MWCDISMAQIQYWYDINGIWNYISMIWYRGNMIWYVSCVIPVRYDNSCDFNVKCTRYYLVVYGIISVWCPYHIVWLIYQYHMMSVMTWQHCFQLDTVWEWYVSYDMACMMSQLGTYWWLWVHSEYALSQLETTLHCNVAFYWLSAYPEWYLMSWCQTGNDLYVYCLKFTEAYVTPNPLWVNVKTK